jgi:spore coat polysaccharide biosynthesis predicted glycosyltransferase SpsG
MDVIVLDGYVFNVALQSRLRDAAPLVVVDDLGLPAACDLAVNPSPGGEGLRPSGAHRFLGGAAYALLRESFVDARDSVLLRGRAGRTVLVSTGATDIDGIAERVSEELLERDDTVEIVRVIGPDAPPDAAAHQRRLRLLVSPQSLAEALTGVTVYVGAAGTTAVQAACVGIPAVVSAMVPNQRAQAGALAAAGCAIVVEPDDLTTACLQLLDDPDRCEQMGAHGRTLVDGRGAERVAAALRDCLRRGAP